MLLKDKVAVITGGAGLNGLGFATARLMAQHGARVAVLDLARAEPATAAAKLGDGHLGVVADVTDKASCDAAIAAVLKAFGRIDVLVNNAGITQPRKTVDITGADYDAILDVSLRGTLLMSQAVIPQMQRQQSGSIICISSVSAQRGGGILGGPHYSAAKAGVLGLARAMAREFGPDSIRVNSHHARPDRDRHHQGQAHRRARRPRSQRRFRSAAWAWPTTSAGACVYLASDLSCYCTGITLDVNGGMLIH